MKYSSIINQVLILFLIMLVGYVARKKNVIDGPTNKGLAEMLLGITLPAMIIVSFNYSFSKEMLIKAGVLLVISSIIHLSLAFISKLLYYKVPKNENSVLRFITVFSNCGFMGYPIVGSIYGKIGIFYTAIYNIPFHLLMFTMGVMLFTHKKNFKSVGKEIINPSMISIFIGMLIFMFSIKLPYPIYKTLDLIGSTTTPLSMMVIGSMIAEIDIKNVFSGTIIYYGAFVRLILTPLIVFFVLKLFGATGMNLGIPVIISGMPAAANSAIMAQKYGADHLLASRFVFVTTIISVITIPFIIIAIQ
jgi:malate permease and related proteins